MNEWMNQLMNKLINHTATRTNRTIATTNLVFYIIYHLHGLYGSCHTNSHSGLDISIWWHHHILSQSPLPHAGSERHLNVQGVSKQLYHQLVMQKLDYHVNLKLHHRYLFRHSLEDIICGAFTFSKLTVSSASDPQWSRICRNILKRNLYFSRFWSPSRLFPP